MDIAYKHFKEAVKYRFAPATEGLDEDEEIEYSPEDYEVENTELPLGGRLVDTAWTAQVDEPYLELGSFQAEVGYHVPHAS